MTHIEKNHRQFIDSNTTISEPIYRIVEILREQSIAPPGGDLGITKFNLALSEILLNDTNVATRVSTALEARSLSRKSIKARHIANLLLRVFNYVQIWNNQQWDYPRLLDSVDEEESLNLWITAIRNAMVSMDNDNCDTFFRLLEEKDTQTNIYQRGIAIPSIINQYFHSDAITIIDIGCSTNALLCGLADKTAFLPVQDQTNDQRINKYSPADMNIHAGIGVDLTDPHLIENKMWQMACRYPREINTDNLSREWTHLIDDNCNEKITFVQANIVTTPLKFVHGTPADVIVFSTMLYQLEPEERNIALSKARSLLSSKGIIIIQDFAEYTNGEWHYTTDWGKKGAYRTYIIDPENNILEAYQYDSGRCNEVYEGSDYDKVFALN
ncbi:MAG: hypothetical protein ACEQSA_00530 [Weeksellaceae bacterium]